MNRPVMSGAGLYDPTSIMNADTLNKCQREGWVKLAFYLLAFFYYLYGWVIRDIPSPTSSPTPPHLIHHFHLHHQDDLLAHHRLEGRRSRHYPQLVILEMEGILVKTEEVPCDL